WPPRPEPLRHCNRRLAAAPPCRHGLLNGIASDASRELRAAELDERLGSPRRRATGRAHERDLASGLEPLYAGGGEGARGQLGLDAGTGDEGDAEPGRGRALDRLLETELEPHVEVAKAHRPAQELIPDHLADPRALLHQDQRLLPELLERDLLAGEPVPRRNDEDHLVAEKRLEDDAAVPRRRADYPELQLALGALLDDSVRVRDRQGDGKLGVYTLKPPGQDRNDSAAGSRRGAECELAAQRTVFACKLVEQLALHGEHPLRGAIELLSRLGRLDTPPGAVEQLRPEPLLERTELQADRRLGDGEPLSRIGAALAFQAVAAP